MIQTQEFKVIGLEHKKKIAEGRKHMSENKNCRSEDKPNTTLNLFGP
jgi:hypothetical protein